jgi:two-component system response regulator FixJ
MIAPHPLAPVVHVIDDDEAVRRSLVLLLASAGHATRSYASAEEFLDDVDPDEPGCAVIDVRMPGMGGLELQRRLNASGWNLPAVIVTGHADVALAVRAMKEGAVDFIEKPYTGDDMLRAVAGALARSADARQHRAAAELAAARIATLTSREREVLSRLIEGRPNKMIAHELGISPRTVEIHRANVMEKLDCRNLAAVVRLALTAGETLA